MVAMLVRVITCLCAVVRLAVCATSRSNMQYSTKNLHNCVESGHQRYINFREFEGYLVRLLAMTPKRTAMPVVTMTMAVSACVLVCLALCVCVLGNEGYEATQRSKTNLARNRMHCTKAQSNIDFQELMGLWNVIEVIEHSERYNERRNYLRSSDSCPVVHFSTDEDREVRMLWNDEDGYIQYSFRMTNVNNPGFWMSLGYQSGTMVDDHYEHFSGTAQVMKAVQSHMVLTFCSPHEKHFSVILSRSKHLSYEEVRGVHKQLTRVNLPLVAVKSYCESAGVSLNPSVVVATLLALAVGLRSHLA